ncbi:MULTISPECIES: hypothetical protein [Sandaracinus]|uniref:hypothetical protein n=1 Tax=Sandaracinus TaxID=1055688 RepID=UPI0019D4219D|nr:MULTISPECIES: hypothetical protein [Sandaracinus]UJR87240.1 Hypothetical protein I5071_320 [Sandaracinus amylolyticus]
MAVTLVASGACREDARPAEPMHEVAIGRAHLGGANQERTGTRAVDEYGPSRAPVGFGAAQLPTDPPPTTRRALRAALRARERGEHDVSERALAEIVAAQPLWALARFEHACALALLGRNDEAAAELESAVLRDLPEIAPRLERDADLAALRASQEWGRVERALAAARADWEGALIQGAIVVHETVDTRDEGGWKHAIRRTAQPGVWLHDEQRFVPMGPRVSAESNDPVNVLATSILDRERRVVVTATGLGVGEEGDSISELTKLPHGVRFRATSSRATSGRAPTH